MLFAVYDSEGLIQVFLIQGVVIVIVFLFRVYKQVTSHSAESGLDLGEVRCCLHRMAIQEWCCESNTTFAWTYKATWKQARRASEVVRTCGVNDVDE